jgi:uncharacterized protein (DUF433 family)
MRLTLASEPIPLAADPDGSMRVAGTRVTLDSIVSSFHQGATAEQIAQQYPSVALSAVYALLAYYLRHQKDVDAYLNQRQVEAEQLRHEAEARMDPQGIRDRLLARRAAGQKP